MAYTSFLSLILFYGFIFQTGWVMAILEWCSSGSFANYWRLENIIPGY